MKKRIKKVDMQKCCTGKNNSCGGPLYLLGAIGAAIYNISVSTGFWSGVLGIIKALIWPVFLVLELMKFLVM